MCRSVPQIVVVVIAHDGVGGRQRAAGRGLSSQARRPGPWYTSAFMVAREVRVGTSGTTAVRGHGSLLSLGEVFHTTCQPRA